MTGPNGIVVKALAQARVREILAKYGRG